MRHLCVGGPLDAQWHELPYPPKHGATYNFAAPVEQSRHQTGESGHNVAMHVVTYQVQAWEVRDTRNTATVVYVLHPVATDPTRTLERLVRGYKRPPEPEAR